MCAAPSSSRRPAGSGKTELLVRRFLKLLSSVQKPEEILAITFTKKAAAEMRSVCSSACRTPAKSAHRLRIQTIDAFCTALTRQVPVLARFGAQPRSSKNASELYLEAAARVFKQFNPASEKLLAHLDNDIPKVTRLLADRLKGSRPLAAQDRRGADSRRAGGDARFRAQPPPRSREGALPARHRSARTRLPDYKRRVDQAPAAAEGAGEHPGPARGAVAVYQHAAGAVRRPAMGGRWKRSSRFSSPPSAPQGACSASAARPTSPSSLTARSRRSARSTIRATCCSRSTEDLARPGRRVPGHLALAIRAPHQADFRLAGG